MSEESAEVIPIVPATEQPFAAKSEPVEDDGQPDEIEQQEEPINLNEPDDDEGGSEDDPEPEDDQESAEDDLEEFEWDGKTISGPKGLKDGVMMQADYTKKTQEVAERRKELESFEQSLKARAESSEEETSVRAEAWALENALKQYDEIDWDAWTDQDPVGAQKGRWQFEDLRRRVGDSKQKVTEFANKRSQEAQQDFAKRVGQTREFAQKHIKGFSPDVEKRVVEFAMEQGVTQTQLQSSLSPVMFDILHKAMLGAELMKKPASPPHKKAVPLKTVSSRSNTPVGKSLSDMSMDEYVKAREAQGYRAANHKPEKARRETRDSPCRHDRPEGP